MANKNQKNTTPKNDERNIVGADQVNVQDVEDQLFLIWEKNKGTIIAGIAFIVAAFLGFQGLKAYQKSAERGLMEGYQTADEGTAKEEWADDHAGKPLGGFANKELGDEAFEAGEFSKAEAHYRAAAKAATSAIKEAANLALAVTLQEQGKTAEAKSVLEKLANDDSAANQAEAQYRLALIAKAAGDFELVRSLSDSISEDSSFWKARARSLEQGLPKSDA